MKNLKVCKMYYYYEQLIFLSSMLMPLGWTADFQNDWNLIENQMNFTYFYFDLWPSLLCSMVTQLLTPVSRMLVYEEEIDSSVMFMTLLTILQ